MTRMPAGRDALVARVRHFATRSLTGRTHEDFEDLALAVHAWQREHDPVIASLSPALVSTWTDIPAVPVALYKALPVGTVKRDPPPVAFRTSGTTGSGRGVHRLWDTELYDWTSLVWAQQQVPRMPRHVAALLHAPSDAPDSSLSHMVALFAPRTQVTWHLHDGALDLASLDARIRSAPEPLFVAATAFALAEWLEAGPPMLPEGSTLMVTGGFKGRTTELDHDQLLRLARVRLFPQRVVTEYGMTELCSQLWGTPDSAFEPPPWLRVVAVDPATGTPLPPGERGQLRFYDLVNVDSSVGVETMDAGVVHEDGSVSLDGRLEGAEPRGCSLTVEEAWGRA